MSDLLNTLNEVNDVKITSVFDSAFNEFGYVHTGYELDELIDYMESDGAYTCCCND